MKARMERILIKLAQREAPYLLTNPPADIDERLSWLADGLAQEGVLVVAGDIPQENYAAQVRSWITAYRDLALVIANGIFPKSAGLVAVYADDNRPPIVVMTGQPAAVMEQLGRYIAPFLALRQNDTVSETELRGLMQFILEELEARDLDRQIYDKIWQDGIKILRFLLNMNMQHFAVTSAAQSVMREAQRDQLAAMHIPQAPSVSQEQNLVPPTPPEMLPEQPISTDETATENMFTSDIPLFPSAKRTTGELKRRTMPVPKVPGLDNNDEKKS